MPTNENLYGQWPKCGEIDIMEVMGQQTNKLYGTIHYGEPHAESQGTKILAAGDFADEYHTFACEWEPGAIRWYVDGIFYTMRKMTGIPQRKRGNGCISGTVGPAILHDLKRGCRGFLGRQY